MSDYNVRIVDEFRANGGSVSTGHGSSLVLLHTVGAKSGERRIHPLLAIPEGSGWLVIASKGGAPENPAWYHNLRAHPDVEVEVPAGDHVETVDVHATELTDAEYREGWKQFTARSRAFEQYRDRTERRMPIIRLARR